MLYYTQLIYLQKGKETLFHTFEDHVLPLMARHNGQLLYRVRPPRTSVISSSVDEPYEVHLVAFATREDFVAYATDEERQSYLHLKERSVAKVLLIEGSELNEWLIVG